MQSFTTQAHVRNYRGNIILQTSSKTKVKRHRTSNFITTICLVFAVAVTGSLLGVMTIHNQQLKRKIQSLTTQVSQPSPEQTYEMCQPCNITYEPIKKRGKTLPRIPISNQRQDTEPMPSVENTLH